MSRELRPPLTGRLRPGHWVALDCALAGIFALSVLGVLNGHDPGYDVPSAAVKAVAMVTVLAVAARRPWPLATLVVVQGGAAAVMATGVGWQLVGAVMAVLYTVALRLPLRRSAIALAAVLLAAGMILLVSPRLAPEPYMGGLAAVSVPLLIAVWAIGLAVRQQRAYTAALNEQAERRARAEAAEERLRVSRELHDVVAHGMSLIALQAGVANYVIGERPEEAARALASIETTSRSALTEMRTLLGVLRDGDGAPVDPQLAPAPGLADLDRLTARTVQAGVRVDLETRGRARELPAGVDLAAYRIVQEALTNVIKHAGSGGCRVTVAYEDAAVSVEVVDEGRGAVPSTGGHGLAGMRERTRLYGGEFEAGPLPGRGFRVAARLPLGGEGR